MSNNTTNTLLIDRLTEFADKQYQNNYAGCFKKVSSRCPLRNCYLYDYRINNCQNGNHTDSYQCECCLDEIHSAEVENSYSCQNSCYVYICKYMHKYASETYNALKELNLPNNININILSFGCGPATELCALDKLQNDAIISSYNYLGVDLNTNWKNIHDFYTAYFAQKNTSQVTLATADANNYLTAGYIQEADIIIFNYLLSDMIKFSGYQNVKTFLEEIARLFHETKHYPAIIFNDIAVYYNGRCGTSLVNQIFSAMGNYNFKVLRFYDSNSSSKSRPYLLNAGFIPNSDTSLAFQVTDHCIKYNPYLYLGSAQIILQQR